MSDILLLQERIKNTILLGESHFREFKSAFEGAPGQKKTGNVKNICAKKGVSTRVLNLSDLSKILSPYF